jgi:hypothetical protein
MFTFEPKNFPMSPGVYLMKGARGKILYVGKAKNLRSRLSSYFRNDAGLTVKTAALVAKVEGVDVLLTASEKEALLLESSLIKKHRPRYNIVLKDDKNYILFKLDKLSPFPRLAFTRRRRGLFRAVHLGRRRQGHLEGAWPGLCPAQMRRPGHGQPGAALPVPRHRPVPGPVRAGRGPRGIRRPGAPGGGFSDRPLGRGAARRRAGDGAGGRGAGL